MRLVPLSAAVALAGLSGWGSAAADDLASAVQIDLAPAGEIEWISDVRSKARAPSLRRPLGQTGYQAATGIRVPFGEGESRVRLIAAETVLGDGLQQRNSFGSSVDLVYGNDEDRSFRLALEWLDNVHPADQAEQDSVSYAAKGTIIQRLPGALAPELSLHTELSSERNRRGNRALSGVGATALAEVSVFPAPDWELSLGLSAESARVREPAPGASVARGERYGGAILAAEHALSPTTRIRCEAEAGTMRSTDPTLDGPQRQVGCSFRIEL